MPTNYIKKLSNNYNIPISDLENEWNLAKSDIRTDKSDTKYWIRVMSDFKKRIQTKFNIHEQITIPNMIDFIEMTEEFETQEIMPTKEISNQNIRDKKGL